jgi:hypothetical protein
VVGEPLLSDVLPEGVFELMLVLGQVFLVASMHPSAGLCSVQGRQHYAGASRLVYEGAIHLLQAHGFAA